MADEQKTYRMLRVLEYTGSLEFINKAMEQRGVKGTRLISTGNPPAVIREAILGDTAELIDDYGKDYVVVMEAEKDNG